MKILLVFLLLLGLIGLVLMIAGPDKLWNRLARIEPVDLSTWPGRETPNWALACPGAESGGSYCTGAEPTHTSPSVHASADEVFEWFVSSATGDNIPGASVMMRDDNQRKARFQILSCGLKFPDIVDLEVVDLETGQVGVAILSQSLIGKQDFGVNAQRLDGWLKAYSEEFQGE